MTACNDMQSQLLAYLYDLLDDTDRRALEQHLEGCAGCKAARARARDQQLLIAAAAKAEFAGVRFEPPTITPARPAAAGGGSFVGTRFALAASILLVLGLGLPGGWWTAQYWSARHETELASAQLALAQSQQQQHLGEYQARLTAAAQKIQETQEQINARNQEHANQVAALEKAWRDQQLNVVVSGPAVVQPGAPSQFEILTKNLNDQPVPAKLDARVLDDAKKVVFEQKDIAATGTFKLTLPPNLPLKPQTHLALEVVARRDGAPDQKVREEVPLVAPVYLTHLATDKPMYRPGETVHFRSLTLERFSLKPASENLQLTFTVTDSLGSEVYKQVATPRLLSAQGNEMLRGPDGQPLQGLGAGEYVIPATANGGEYTLKVSEANQRFADQQRKFIVNKYENPRLNKELDFSRKSYGPGDEVAAACKVARAEGGAPVAHRPVIATVFIDGQPYGPDGKPGATPIQTQTDEKGAVTVRFRLPAAIERGLATLSVQFNDGGSVETLVRPIPVVVKKLQVDFFPEGGDLVAGAPNRVYFQVHSMLGKPADLQGHIVDQTGKVVVPQLQTLNDAKEPGVNQGQGLFAFQPEPGHQYELKIDSPAGMVSKHPLPAVKPSGVVLSVAEGVTQARQPIHVVLYSPDKERTLLVGAYCRGRLMDHQTVQVKPGQATAVDLNPVQNVTGVYRITAFEERAADGAQQRLVPVAERLTYRKADDGLLLTVKSDKPRYVPGDKVHLTFSALNDREQPAPAVMMVAVVDKSVITMADEKTARTMPTHYFLTTEVRKPEELEYADFLLTTHPKATQALDLLLGTQGWRRFAEQNPGDFRQKFGGDADRLLVMTGQSAQKATNLALAGLEKLQQQYQADATRLQDQLAKAMEAHRTLQADPAFAKQQAEDQKSLQALSAAVSSASFQLRKLEIVAQEYLAIFRPLLYVLVGLLLVVCVAMALRQSLRRSLPAYGLALASTLVLLVGLGVSYWSSGQDRAESAAWQLAYKADAQAKRAENAAMQMMPMEAPPAPAPMAPRMMGRGGALPEGMPGAKGNGGFGGGGFMGGGVPENAPGLGVANGANLHFGADRAKGEPFGNPKLVEEAREGKDAHRDFFLNRGIAPQLGAKGEQPARNFAFREQEALAKKQNLDRPAIEMDKPLAADLKEKKKPPVEAQLRQQMAAGLLRAGVEKEERAGKPMDARRQMDAMGVPGPMAAGGFAAGRRLMKIAPGGGAGAADMELAPPPPPMVIREFAHQRSPGTPSEERTDFVDTIYWHPALVLANGKVDVGFDLCDAVTTYQVTAFAHTLDGRLGALTSTVEARLPFTIEPKLPIEVTATDKIDIPVSIANNTDAERAIAIRLAASNLYVSSKSDDMLKLASEARGRRVFRVQPSIVEGSASLRLEGRSEPFGDSVTRGFKVVPDGFPIVGQKSDLLEGAANNEVRLPDSWIKGTLKCKVEVYPSTLADLQNGLEALLREPCGCFEQTSTSNYPNLLILQYLKETDQAKPEIENRARTLLANGYQKLVSFECLEQSKNLRRGYEWFGGIAPAHEALSAYGLLEFRDMAKVYDVDAKMLERTRDYLMSRKDGKGGFLRNPQALDTFGRAPDDITNAYIVWSITESGKDDDVSKELTALAQQAKDSKDPYFVSLVALSLINRGQTNDGVALLKTVSAAQKEDGHVDATRTSITGSGGRDLQIETTALAVLGWLKANRPADFNLALQKGVKWLGQQRGGYGGFGSTQSTILTLKALIAYAKANKRIPEAGELKLTVNGQAAAQLAFPANAQEALSLAIPEPEKILKPGKNEVAVEITGKNAFPYTLSWTYQTVKPASADNFPVRLSTRLDRPTVTEGDAVHLTVSVENTQDKGQGMAVAIIGLPAGLTLPEDFKQLKDHARLRNDGKERGLIDAWETRGRELILYWRDLAPKQKIEVPVDLICRVPGEYRGPASRAYLYYNADLKHWVDPLAIKIQPKAE